MVCASGGERAAVGDVWHVLAVPADGLLLSAPLPAAQRALARAAHPAPRPGRQMSAFLPSSKPPHPGVDARIWT